MTVYFKITYCLYRILKIKTLGGIMKKIISVLAVLLLFTACENKKDKKKNETTKTVIEDSKKTNKNSNLKEPAVNTPSSPTDSQTKTTSNSQTTSPSQTKTYKGTGYGDRFELDCSVTVPQNATDLTNYKLVFSISPKEEAIIIHPVAEAAVVQNPRNPNLYESQTEPFVILDYQNGNLIRFRLYKQTGPGVSDLKTYNCTFE